MIENDIESFDYEKYRQIIITPKSKSGISEYHKTNT